MVVRPVDAPSWKASAARRLGVSDAVFRGVWDALKNTRLTSVYPFERLLVEICVQAGVVADEETVHQLGAERRAAKAACFADVDSAVVAMLDDLARSRVPMAVLSTSPARRSTRSPAPSSAAASLHAFFRARSGTPSRQCRRTT